LLCASLRREGDKNLCKNTSGNILGVSSRAALTLPSSGHERYGYQDFDWGRKNEEQLIPIDEKAARFSETNQKRKLVINIPSRSQ
jgi:hypothetical protein